MVLKLVILTCSVTVTLAAWHGPLAGGKPADLYPAGVSPHACPNYPHCANPAVAVSAQGAIYGGHGGWNGAHGGAWNGGYAGAWNGGHNNGNDGAWNGHHGAHNALYTGEYTGDGDYHGEGLAESGAFGPVHHDNGGYHATPAYAVAYGHHGHPIKYPAGVHPHTCPNYPYCH